MEIGSGNAHDVAQHYRGWILGAFMPPGQPLHSEAIEIKWATHPAGQERHEWSSSEATTISILVRGCFFVVFDDHEVLLQREGDFVIWPPDTRHTWRAEAESLLVTARWPSRP